MPLQIIRDDITRVKCDAIVNAANTSLLGGGGVDGAIHKAAGPKLLEECKKLGGCDFGQAKLTAAYDLPAKYIIHTVGPIWQGGKRGEEALLRSCYAQSLALAQKKRCKSIAFPLISSGAYGYPKDQALKIATEEIGSFLKEKDMLVYIVVFDSAAYKISDALFGSITAYIDDRYAKIRAESTILAEARRNCELEQLTDATESFAAEKRLTNFLSPVASMPALSQTVSKRKTKDLTLSERIAHIDESFSQMLLRKIDEKNMTDSQCYKKANIDRKLFSKIRKDDNYKPSKTTAIAFAIALELSREETDELLMKAGFALSSSNKFDIIIEYFIENANYDIFEINSALFAFDQNLLGV